MLLEGNHKVVHKALRRIHKDQRILIVWGSDFQIVWKWQTSNHQDWTGVPPQLQFPALGMRSLMRRNEDAAFFETRQNWVHPNSELSPTPHTSLFPLDLGSGSRKIVLAPNLNDFELARDPLFHVLGAKAIAPRIAIRLWKWAISVSCTSGRQHVLRRIFVLLPL